MEFVSHNMFYIYIIIINCRFYNREYSSPLSEELIIKSFIMLKLEDFKIKEIETLDSIKGGNIPCLDLTHHFVNFLGWIIETGTSGDIHPD